MTSSAPNELRPSHKRSTSSVLKSIINPRAHKRSPSDGAVLANRVFNDNYGIVLSRPAGSTAAFPKDIHQEQLPLFDVDQNEARTQPSPSKRGLDWSIHDDQNLSGQSQSTVHPHSQSSGAQEIPGRNGSKSSKAPSEDPTKKPKKTKSQTSLAAIFSRPKASKNEKKEVEVKDKENTTPPASSSGSDPPPIWAQFASRPLQSQSTVNLHAYPASTRYLDDEIALYTPTQYSAGQQRNFNDSRRPSLSQRPSASRPRPYSIHVSSNSSSSSLMDVMTSTRRSSGERIQSALAGHDIIGAARRFSLERSGPEAFQSGTSSPNMAKNNRGHLTQHERVAPTKRGTKVLAAVAAFNSKGKETQKSSSRTNEGTEEAFERLLASLRRLSPQDID
jgi:hypothetical protein